jgi:hypothetical protein
MANIYYFETDNKTGSGAAQWADCYVLASSKREALAKLQKRGKRVSHIERVVE